MTPLGEIQIKDSTMGDKWIYPCAYIFLHHVVSLDNQIRLLIYESILKDSYASNL